MLKIWDLSIRIYHWLQAALVFALAASGIGWLPSQAHPRLGILLLVLLIWRLGWGVFGSDTARFSQFVKSPLALIRYVKNGEWSGVGHNPLGALMVVALITSLLVQALSGLLTSDVLDGKALLGRSVVRLLEDIHRFNGGLLMVLALVHIVVIVGYSLKGKKLLRPMITGKTEIPADSTEPRLINQRWAVIWLISSAVVVITLLKLLS